ncbi:MAG: MaoC family dehydratase [Desulfobacterota bacterium]|nr:MaoC family dehydratase [Thermodesulfobacteriota bacterium]
MSALDFNSVNIGDVLPSKTLAVTQELINAYADLSGDYNSIHVDVEGMKNNPMFGGSTIAHGTINVEPLLQAICAIQGTLWPLEGTKIDLQFRAPVKPGYVISSELTVKEKKTEGGKKILVCDMKIKNNDGSPCVLGTVDLVLP